MKRLTCFGALICAAMIPQDCCAAGPALNVPDGFRAELYADDDLAHDVHSLTFNSRGEVVVSGPGYVRTLLDTDEDGKADKVRVFAEAPRSGAQGLFFLGNHLLCSGDDGLQMFRDDNRDGKADGAPEIFLRVMAGREHDAHAIRKGPDGWWYIIAGNMAGVSGAYATLPTSPVKQPESGTLLRLRPDLSGGEIVADGFRNAYDFDFSANGDIFTFDSDGERDVTLPWYEPTRVFQVTPRSHAGWISRSWKRPDYFSDMPPVTGRFGRGSPSGVVTYRHKLFPREYHGAVFVLDWTFGRILALPLQQDGSVSSTDAISFATGTGQYGFAPTDAAVSPNGELFVSIGGRGTQGGVFRISWSGDSAALDNSEDTTDLDQVLQAPQPGASWSRARWVPKARRLSSGPFESAVLDANRPDAERIRAIEILTELYGGISLAAANELATAKSSAVRARTIWSVGRSNVGALPMDVLKKYLKDRDSPVRRMALESLSTLTDSQSASEVLAELIVTLKSEDRFERSAAATVVARLSEKDWQQLLGMLGTDYPAMVSAGIGRQSRSKNVQVELIDPALQVIASDKSTEEQKLDATRLIQLCLGDVGPKRGRPAVFDSVAPQLDLTPFELELSGLVTDVARIFPIGVRRIDHELMRIIGMLSPVNRDLIPKILSGISSESAPSDDIHRLMVLSRIDAERTYDQSVATAAAFVSLDVKIQAQNLPQDANWDDRMGELYRQLCEVDGAIRQVIVDQPGFGLPGHVLLLSEVGQDKVPTAIQHFADRVKQDDDFEWSNDVIFAIGESENTEHRELIRDQLDNLAVRGAILMVLAEKPVVADRDLFVEGLSSAQINVVESCLNALTKLPPSRRPEDQFALLAAARRMMNSPKEFGIRDLAMRVLQNNTGKTFNFVFDEGGHRPQPGPLQEWGNWLRETYPEFRQDLADSSQVLTSLESVDWDSGDQKRGEKLFTKLACAKCHGGRRALGPDLQGVAKRFSRQDLFAAIVEPSRDVSPRYRTTSIVSTTGKTYTGLIVYESVDGLLLRDSDHQTWRIEANEIDERLQQSTSLMPTGLLKDRSTQDLADLNAFIQSL